VRVFLIIFSFINAFLYFLLYAYYDNILALFGGNVASGFLNFLRLLILVIVSFLIGLIVSLLTRIQAVKSFFDYRIALIVGILPFIFLILSLGNISNSISAGLFGANTTAAELMFYFFSRQVVWAMWLGFALGASVRLVFKRKLKHEVIFSNEDIEPSS